VPAGDQHDATSAQLGYRRDGVTWVIFAALFCFGILNAGLGSALPYLRDAEHLSYLGGVLHQAAFALGGGLAGVLTARARRMPGRALVIRGGTLCAGLAWLGVGYGNHLAITAAAAFVVSLLATAALIRMWAVLADVHSSSRTKAMTEGEVVVSLGAIIAPLLISGVAGTALGWRMSFVFAAALVVAAVLATSGVPIPESSTPRDADARPKRTSRRIPAALVVVSAIVALEFSLGFWLASYLGDDVGLDRRLAVAMVSWLFAANLLGRLLASRLAHRFGADVLLAGAIGLALLGMPVLLLAGNAATAAIGLALVGTGGGAMFPLTSSLHVGASPRGADAAIGQVIAAASIGIIVGPVFVAGLAEIINLRVGLLSLVGYALIAATGLHRHVSGSTGQRCEEQTQGLPDRDGPR
jgi:MFS family permease